MTQVSSNLSLVIYHYFKGINLDQANQFGKFDEYIKNIKKESTQESREFYTNFADFNDTSFHLVLGHFEGNLWWRIYRNDRDK